MPGKMLWDPKMKGFGPINMKFGTAWWYMSLNPSFSPENLCNLAPFQSEHTTWGAESIVPLKIPNVLFSENSLFVSEAALGCCSGFLTQQNLPEQLGETGAFWLLQIHTWSENMHSLILFRALYHLPSAGHSCTCPSLPTLDPVKTPDVIQGALCTYFYWQWNPLFDFFEIQARWRIIVEQF